jgi:hypothetical protein
VLLLSKPTLIALVGTLLSGSDPRHVSLAMEREVVRVLEPHLHAPPIGVGMAALRDRRAVGVSGSLDRTCLRRVQTRMPSIASKEVPREEVDVARLSTYVRGGN